MGSPRERGLGEEGTGGLGGAEGKCYEQDGQTAGPTAQPREDTQHPAVSDNGKECVNFRTYTYVTESVRYIAEINTCQPHCTSRK